MNDLTIQPKALTNIATQENLFCAEEKRFLFDFVAVFIATCSQYLEKFNKPQGKAYKHHLLILLMVILTFTYGSYVYE